MAHPTGWEKTQRFMVLADSFWYESDDGWWRIMHGNHDIKLNDQNEFCNYYNEEPKVVGKLEDACIMTSEFIYMVTLGMESPIRKDYMSTDYYDDREFDYAWEDMQWRMEQAAQKKKKRRYLV